MDEAGEDHYPMLKRVDIMFISLSLIVIGHRLFIMSDCVARYIWLYVNSEIARCAAVAGRDDDRRLLLLPSCLRPTD